LVLGAGVWMETATVDIDRGRPLFYEETRYGRLTVFQDRGEATLFRDGRPAVTARDPAAAEAAVHYPLAVLDRPKAVLVIGGSGAMLAELDKYRLETVDYVEIDPAAVRLQIAAGLMSPGGAVNRIHRAAQPDDFGRLHPSGAAAPALRGHRRGQRQSEEFP
jgi:hypothetical protein